MTESVKYIQDHLTKVELWGQLAEEAAELAQAALKMQRLFLDTNKPRKDVTSCLLGVIEEHADLALCFEVLEWHDKPERDKIKNAKAERWAGQIRARFGDD